MKTILRNLLLLPLMAILLPGCYSPAGTDAASAVDTALADRAGAGILQLEGQALEVDATQAAEMLPLWQALLTLSTDSNTTPEEITALNTQITQSLSSEQAEAIHAMNLDDEAMIGLMQKYQAFSSQPVGTVSSSSSQPSGPAGGADMGSAMPGGGAPMDGGGMMMVAAGSNTQTTTSHADLPGQSEREEAGGKNLIFARAVIDLLESKINPA